MNQKVININIKSNLWQVGIYVNILNHYLVMMFIVKAVDGACLNMYKEQVFCLLGHRGAGKTTTIGMLSGRFDVFARDYTKR